MEGKEDRRRFPRTELNWPVNVIVDDEIIAGETVDISPEGIHVSCDDPVPMNEPLKLTIAPPDRELINVTAKVVWSDLDGIDAENRSVGMGLCFVEISDADRSNFDEAVADHLG